MQMTLGNGVTAAGGGSSAPPAAGGGRGGAGGTASAATGGMVGAAVGGAAGDALASAGAAGQAMSGGGAGAAPPETATCNTADKGPAATPVTVMNTGAKPTGPFNVIIEQDPGLTDHTVYRPEPFGMQKFPVLTWGNGGCSKMSTGFAEFLTEVASHGFLIIADGTPTGSCGCQPPTRQESRTIGPGVRWQASAV